MKKDNSKCIFFKKSKKALSVFGEVLGLIICFIFLYYIFPKLVFITPSYYEWLPIGLGTAIISSLLKIIKHIINSNWLKKSMDFLSNVVSLFSTYQLSMIFPFDFNKINMPSLNNIFSPGLKALVVILAIATVVNFFQIFFPKCTTDSKK